MVGFHKWRTHFRFHYSINGGHLRELAYGNVHVYIYIQQKYYTITYSDNVDLTIVVYIMAT